MKHVRILWTFLALAGIVGCGNEEEVSLCGPENCSGCCIGDTCESGDKNDECGIGGVACETCGENEECVEGVCTKVDEDDNDDDDDDDPPPACSPHNCSGCCRDDVCEPGDSEDGCGRNGVPCKVCGPTETCSLGTCVDPDMEGTVIKEIADNLDPGEFEVITTGEYEINIPQGYDFTSFSQAYLYRSLGNSSDMWGPVCDWDPVTKQSYSIIDRTSAGEECDRVAFGGYNAATHEWMVRPLPEESESCENGQFFGRPHVYGSWCLASEQGRFYRPRSGQLHWFEIDEQKWYVEPYSGSFGGGFAFLPSTEEIMSVNSNGEVWALDTHTLSTRKVGEHSGYDGDGTHINGVYNRQRDEIMMLASSRDFILINGEGEIITTGTAPLEMRGSGSWRHEAFFYDPMSGNYLAANRDAGHLWEFDPETLQWQEAWHKDDIDFPWPNYNGFLITVIDELGVILWVDRSHQRVYRHKTVFED